MFINESNVPLTQWRSRFLLCVLRRFGQWPRRFSKRWADQFVFFVFLFSILLFGFASLKETIPNSPRPRARKKKQTNKQTKDERGERKREESHGETFSGRDFLRPATPSAAVESPTRRPRFLLFSFKKTNKNRSAPFSDRRRRIMHATRRHRSVSTTTSSGAQKETKEKKNPEFLSTCRFYERHRASLLLLLFFYSLLYGSLIGFLYRHAPVAEFLNQFHSVVLDWPMRTEEKKKKKERRFTAARLYFSAFVFTRPRPPGWSSCQTWRTAASWGPASPLWSWRSRLRSWQCPCRLGSWPPPAAPVWPEQRGERKKNRRLVHFLRGGLPDEVEATQTLASSSPRWAKTSPMTKGTGADSSSTMRRSSEASSRFWRSLCASVGGCGH